MMTKNNVFCFRRKAQQKSWAATAVALEIMVAVEMPREFRSHPVMKQVTHDCISG